MVKRNRIYNTKVLEIVFIRNIVSMPSNNIKNCMILRIINIHYLLYRFYWHPAFHKKDLTSRFKIIYLKKHLNNQMHHFYCFYEVIIFYLKIKQFVYRSILNNRWITQTCVAQKVYPWYFWMISKPSGFM